MFQDARQGGALAQGHGSIKGAVVSSRDDHPLHVFRNHSLQFLHLFHNDAMQAFATPPHIVELLLILTECGVVGALQRNAAPAWTIMP